MSAVFSILELHKGDFYAAMGSREAPAHVKELMVDIAAFLSRRGVILRSGGSEGDSAFERGAGELKEVYLPWGGFNRNHSELFDCYTDRHHELIRSFHPGHRFLSCGQIAKGSRRMAQLFGADFRNPSKCLICWTRDGHATGSTGLAIKVAQHESIPVLNLHDEAIAAGILEIVSYPSGYSGHG